MFSPAKWLLAAACIWGGFALTGQEPKPATDAKPDAKSVDLTALREAISTATKRGENVDEVVKAFNTLEKSLANLKRGEVPPELQSLRDAVDAAAKKGENVEAITKELVAVEMAIAGKTLAKPRPEPKPELPENPFARPNPLVPFPVVPFPNNPGGGIDVEAFQKAMELRMKALDMMAKNPRDPDARKLLTEANELLMKAMRNNGGANIVPPVPVFPDFNRVPDRGRLGIRMEKIPAITIEQLGIAENTGIAISAVVPGSAAEKAGLTVHDIILEFAGKPVSDNTEEFVRIVSAVKADEKVDMVVLRKGKKVEVKGVTLPEVGRAPAIQPFPVLPPAFPRPMVPNNPFLPNANPLPVNPGRLPLPPQAPAGFDGVGVSVENGAFTLKAKKGDTQFVITGNIDNAAKPTIDKITIDDNGKTHTSPSIEKLPEQYHRDVLNLLKVITRENEK